MEQWKQLTAEFNGEMQKVLQIHRLAAQYIALTGRYLLPEKKDQSNITMQYIPENEMLLGNQHPEGWLAGLQLKKLLLQIRNDNMTVMNEVQLEGKTFPEALIEYKKALQKSGVDVSFLKTEQPYELPTDLLDKGMFFTRGPEDAVNEHIRHRYNANSVLNQVRSGYSGACPVRIWPNHFDTGFTFPAEHNREGKETKIIGMGWAIPDDTVDEPYYYLSFLSDEPVDENSFPGDLPAGNWMMPRWNGAVLRLSEIIEQESAENQFALVKLFLESAAQRMLEHFKVSQ